MRHQHTIETCRCRQTIRIRCGEPLPAHVRQVIVDCACPDLADLENLADQSNEAERILLAGIASRIEPRMIDLLRDRARYLRQALTNELLRQAVQEGAD